ncbi:MAG: hypothetical protein PHP46_05195 [Candidatus Omnitrophica bacterium]|nr:hypothetical protein [Candidatus Omnitrophota bacterium]
MLDLLVILVWLACVLIVGWSALSFTFKKGPSSPGERMALSYGAGIGLITIEMALLSFFNIKFNIFSIMIWWVPLVAWALLSDYREKRFIFSPAGAKKQKPFSLAEKFFIFGISFEAVYAFFRALIKPMEAYDAIAIYALKAKIFYFAKAVPHGFAASFKDIVPHVEYPLLLPLSETFFYIFSGSVNDLAVKIMFPLYYLALLSVFYFLSRRFLERKASLFFTFLFATIPQITDFATNGYADLPLAFYCSTSFFYLYLWLRQKERSFLVISFICSLFALWTKTEGLVFALINAAVAVICMMKQKQIRPVGLIYALLSVLAVAAYLLIVHSIGLAVNEDFALSQASPASRILTGIKRIPAILYEYQIQFFGPKKWNIIWVLFIAGFIAKFRKSFSKDILPATLAIAFVFAGYTAIYMLSAAPQGFGWHLSTSGSRLFIHFLPITVFWLVLIFKESKLEI